MVNIVKEKSAGRKKTKSTQKRKGSANQKQVKVKRVVLPCDDMIAKPNCQNQRKIITFCLC